MKHKAELLLVSLAEDMIAATQAYVACSGLSLAEMPEHLLQGWFFKSRHKEFTISIETPVATILSWHKIEKEKCRYNSGNVDLVIYGGDDIPKSKQDVFSIIELKRTWVDIWHDADRTENLLEVLSGKDGKPRLAVVAGVCWKGWREKNLGHLETRRVAGWEHHVMTPFNVTEPDTASQTELEIVLMCRKLGRWTS